MIQIDWPVILTGAAVGAILAGVYTLNPGNLPNALTIGNKLADPLVWGVIGAYYMMSIFLLWIFFTPESTAQILAVVGGGVLWGTF